MNVLRAAVFALAIFVLSGTVLSLIRTDAWWVRVFDFPRLQMALIGLLLAGGIIVWNGFGSVARPALFGLLLLAVAVHVWQILPYTSIFRKQVLAADAPGSDLRILVSNVLQENRSSERLIRLASDTRPDLILICEADDWWTHALNILERTHPHTILQPQTNTYGMNLYSRLPLQEAEVRFLTDSQVPSMRVGVELDGRLIRFFAVHPRPPGRVKPGTGVPMDSGQRDAELLSVAREVRRLRDPVIVAGDFNDVAWSHTTRLFQRISRLLDPRVGRGLYNTFHVDRPLLRFPLDHLFHSDHFQLVQLERLKDIGSDHFPIMVSLRLQRHAVEKQEAPEPEPADFEEATEAIREHGGKSRRSGASKPPQR